MTRFAVGETAVLARHPIDRPGGWASDWLERDLGQRVLIIRIDEGLYHVRVLDPLSGREYWAGDHMLDAEVKS